MEDKTIPSNFGRYIAIAEYLLFDRSTALSRSTLLDQAMIQPNYFFIVSTKKIHANHGRGEWFNPIVEVNLDNYTMKTTHVTLPFVGVSNVSYTYDLAPDKFAKLEASSKRLNDIRSAVKSIEQSLKETDI